MPAFNVISCHRSSAGVKTLVEKRLPLRLVLFLVVCQLPEVVMRPVERNLSEARWINPCDLPGHLFDPDSDMVGAPYVNEAEIANGIAVRARIALNQAKKLLKAYVEESFEDASFIEGTASHRLSWLPKVNRSEVRRMSIRGACRYWYNVLQYYGVALEQVITDQVLFNGKFLAQCQEAENYLTQTLCQVHIGTFMLRIRLSPDVTRDVMRQEYRSGNHSQRLIRNYIIFRDYVDALGLMVETFELIHQRTLMLSNSTTPFLEPALLDEKQK